MANERRQPESGQHRRGPRRPQQLQCRRHHSLRAGTYNLADIALPSNRTYIGNGATLAGGIGAAHGASNIDISGFTLADAGWEIENSSNINFHNNTIQNGNGSIVLGNDSNITIDNNTFRNDSGTSVGTDGPTSLDHVSVDNNNFDYCFEAVHLVWSGGGNSSVSHNVIQHATRHGIELQGGPQGLIVDGNWIDNWLTHMDEANGNDSHMGISCATGVSDPDSSNLVYATGVKVINNYIGGNGIDLDRTPGGFWDFSAIEIMGSGSVVSGNYITNWGYGILAGWIGGGLTFSNNILVNVRQATAMEENAPSQAPTPTTSPHRLTAKPRRPCRMKVLQRRQQAAPSSALLRSRKHLRLRLLPCRRLRNLPRLRRLCPRRCRQQQPPQRRCWVRSLSQRIRRPRRSRWLLSWPQVPPVRSSECFTPGIQIRPRANRTRLLISLAHCPERETTDAGDPEDPQNCNILPWLPDKCATIPWFCQRRNKCGL